MEELNRMIRKMKVENLARYLMYDVETDVEKTADYEQDLKESYEIFFQKLEDMYSEASRQDDELFRLVTDFAVKHENISFKAGMFIGFQIYKYGRRISGTYGRQSFCAGIIFKRGNSRQRNFT